MAVLIAVTSGASNPSLVQVADLLDKLHRIVRGGRARPPVFAQLKHRLGLFLFPHKRGQYSTYNGVDVAGAVNTPGVLRPVGGVPVSLLGIPHHAESRGVDAPLKHPHIRIGYHNRNIDLPDRAAIAARCDWRGRKGTLPVNKRREVTTLLGAEVQHAGGRGRIDAALCNQGGPQRAGVGALATTEVMLHSTRSALGDDALQPFKRHAAVCAKNGNPRPSDGIEARSTTVQSPPAPDVRPHIGRFLINPRTTSVARHLHPLLACPLDALGRTERLGYTLLGAVAVLYRAALEVLPTSLAPKGHGFHEAVLCRGITRDCYAF
jgi:hypothetical protein